MLVLATGSGLLEKSLLVKVAVKNPADTSKPFAVYFMAANGSGYITSIKDRSTQSAMIQLQLMPLWLGCKKQKLSGTTNGVLKMLRKELLDILACPKCKGKIRYDTKKNKIICSKCRLRYPILEGDIPDMLIEDAEKF